jgi:hypothetical protein
MVIQEATEPSRLTDASGAYSFANIRTGTYRVSEVVPAGWFNDLKDGQRP